MSDEYEFTLYQKNEVFVYRIAPRPPQGHRAEDWKECIWRGRLKILERNTGECVIRLEDTTNGKLFAESRFKLNFEEAVERTVDSSRYFVLRLDDGKGRHAYVGVGFESRNDAFDFNCLLSDYTRRRQYEIEILKNPPLKVFPNKTQNFKLKEGEKIRVELKGHSKSSNLKNLSSDVSDFSSSLGDFLLPPPPPSKTRCTSASSSEAQTVNSTNLFDDDAFSDFIAASSSSLV